MPYLKHRYPETCWRPILFSFRLHVGQSLTFGLWSLQTAVIRIIRELTVSEWPHHRWWRRQPSHNGLIKRFLGRQWWKQKYGVVHMGQFTNSSTRALVSRNLLTHQ